MRKTRFLMILTALLLLLFAVALLGCQGEKPPTEPPVDPPAEPLVIEQGEIIVSDYWNSDPIAVNPRPEQVEGTPLCFEQIAYAEAHSHVEAHYSGALYCADDLAEAAALIQKHVQTYPQDRYAATCEAVSHVDFSQFRLLVFVEYYGSGSHTHRYRMEGIVHDGQGLLTRMMFDPVEDILAETHDIVYMARFVLVRRTDYDAPDNRMQTKAHHYTYPPNVIEQGEILVSDYWEGREAKDGFWLNFEQLHLQPTEIGFTDGENVAHSLTQAAAIIDRITYYQSEDCLALNELVSHIDFDRFCLLFIFEEYRKEDHITRVSPWRMGVEEDGSFLLHYTYIGDENVKYSYGYHEYVRLILVRKETISPIKKQLYPATTYYAASAVDPT